MTPAQLVAQHARLARILAWRYKWANEDFDDVHSDALWGLFTAAQRYDPAGPASFPGFARKRIIGEIVDGRRRRYRAARPPCVPLDGWDGWDEAPDPAPDLCEVVILRDAVARATARLSERDRDIVNMYLAGVLGADIGARFGITQSRVSQIVTKTRNLVLTELQEKAA